MNNTISEFELGLEQYKTPRDEIPAAATMTYNAQLKKSPIVIPVPYNQANFHRQNIQKSTLREFEISPEEANRSVIKHEINHVT